MRPRGWGGVRSAVAVVERPQLVGSDGPFVGYGYLLGGDHTHAVEGRAVKRYPCRAVERYPSLPSHRERLGVFLLVSTPRFRTLGSRLVALAQPSLRLVGLAVTGEGGIAAASETVPPRSDTADRLVSYPARNGAERPGEVGPAFVLQLSQGLGPDRVLLPVLRNEYYCFPKCMDFYTGSKPLLADRRPGYRTQTGDI